MRKTKPKFKIGQKVVFINDYGVNWGEKIITKYEWDEVRGHTYQYEGTDTPWFYSSERNFYALNDIKGIKEATKVIAHHSNNVDDESDVVVSDHD